MPFTFSHPAAVLPFRKFPALSFAGLVIGSITPDFEYFIRMKSKYSHTFDGMFWFDLPLAVLIAFLFFNIARNDLIDNLPVFIKSRLVPLRELNWNKYFAENWAKVLISMLLGIMTHVAWDSFTHRTGWFVQHTAFLGGAVEFFGFKIPVYRVLQHASTVIGGLAILIFIYTRPVQAVHKQIRLSYWVCIIAITFVFTMIGFHQAKYLDMWNVVVMLMASGLTAVMATPFVMFVLGRA